MKMPLKVGIPLLIVMWLASGYTDYGEGKTLLMLIAIGVAMWTAFSLPRPRAWRPESREEDEDDAPPPEVAADEPRVPANGSGLPLSSSRPGAPPARPPEGDPDRH